MENTSTVGNIGCNADGLQGKRVVVIWIGNYGGDIVDDISRAAEKLNK
jgi:cation diffusion facilitator CzcD-associated flavoprotein CzcO